MKPFQHDILPVASFPVFNDVAPTKDFIDLLTADQKTVQAIHYWLNPVYKNIFNRVPLPPMKKISCLTLASRHFATRNLELTARHQLEVTESKQHHTLKLLLG